MPKQLIDWKKNSVKVYSFEIEIEYITSLKDMYKRLHYWMENEEFEDANGLGAYETLYWQRDTTQGTQEHHIWWRAHKHPGMSGVEQTQFTWFLKIDMRTQNTSRSEVMHKGRKWKLYQTNFVINFDSFLIRNYEDGFRGSSLLRGLLPRWKNWIYKDRQKYFEQALMEKSVEFQNVVKEYLKLQQNVEQPPGVFPAGGLT